jgi:putative oxidoreductase
MKKLLQARSYGHGLDFTLLLLRVVAGVGMAVHGWPKIQDPMGWMGPDPFAPGFMLALAAVAEFAGGIALAAGLLTRLAAFGVVSTMGVAVWFHAVELGDPFIRSGGEDGGSYELALVYLAIGLVFLVGGAGRASLDRVLWSRAE